MNTPQLIHSIFTSLPSDPPDHIQWMPPGSHPITASGKDGPVETTIHVNEKTAATMREVLAQFRGKAALGAEDKPYLDFNHDDKEASAHVLDFFWGGSDPLRGGVRAKVQWSEPGKAALKGRAYRRFSPSFFKNEQGEVTGAPLNMGALVNRAAFKTIEPIVAKAGGVAMTVDEEIEFLKRENVFLEESIARINHGKPGFEIIDPILAKDRRERVTKSPEDFLAQAQALSHARGIPLSDAQMILSKKEPELFQAYQASFQGKMQPVKAKAPEPAKDHEFQVQAKQWAEKHKVTLARALAEVAFLQPALFDQYRQFSCAQKPQ